MKIFVKTLKGTKFEIQVEPDDTVDNVKKNIESVKGPDVYPAARQVLTFKEAILKDGTTLDENKVSDNSTVVILLRNKSSPGEGSTSREGSTSTTTTTTTAAQTSHQPPASSPISSAPLASLASLAPPLPAPAISPVLTSASASIVHAVSDDYGQTGSNITRRNILDDSGIPERVEAPPVPHYSPASGQAANPPTQSQPLPVPPSGPNTTPLDLFPRRIPNTGSNTGAAGSSDFLRNHPQRIPNMGSNSGAAGSLDFLRNYPQFHTARAMYQSHPPVLERMLQEVQKKNPNLLALIQENHEEFHSLINEPLQPEYGEPLRQIDPAMPQPVEVTPEERDAIERLVAMGFNRAIVLVIFFACDKNEELAANYLLDHMDEFEE